MHQVGMIAYFYRLCSFSVHAIKMGEKVTSVFEHAIKVLACKDDVSTNRLVSDFQQFFYS